MLFYLYAGLRLHIVGFYIEMQPSWELHKHCIFILLLFMKPVIFSVLFMVLSAAVRCQSTKEIDSLLNTIYMSEKPGASVAIEDNGKIIFEKSFGISNIKTGEKI